MVSSPAAEDGFVSILFSKDFIILFSAVTRWGDINELSLKRLDCMVDGCTD
jgi:hypothetical protein